MSSAALMNNSAARVAALAAHQYPDTMNITAVATISDGAGGQIPNGRTNIYTGVPVDYRPDVRGAKFDANGQLISVALYFLTFPPYLNGSRMVIDPVAHRLDVQAQGSEPEKTFRIVTIEDESGVVLRARCKKEN